MEITLWIVSAVLALASVAAGIIKSFTPQAKLTSMPWTQEYSAGTVKFIGVAELLGGIGVIIPWLVGIAPVLTPIAATGLALVQVLAIAHHVRHKEINVLGMNVIFLLAAAFIAIFRFTAL